MVDQEILNSFRGKFLKIIEWYFYNKNESEEIDEIRAIFGISNKYKIVGRCTLLGDIVVFYNNKIGVISHDEPESKPLVMVKNLTKFKEFVILLEALPVYSEFDNIKKLKGIKKEIKSLKKLAPKNLKDNFENEIFEIQDIIEDKEDS